MPGGTSNAISLANDKLSKHWKYNAINDAINRISPKISTKTSLKALLCKWVQVFLFLEYIEGFLPRSSKKCMEKTAA